MSLLLTCTVACVVDVGAPNKVPRISIVSDISRADTIDAGPSKPIVIAISDSTGKLQKDVVVNIAGAPNPTAGGDFGMLVMDSTGFRATTVQLITSGQTTFHVFFGRHAGQAPIIISVPELKLVDTLWFTVKPGAPAYVTLRPPWAVVVIGGTYQQSAVVIDRGGNDLILGLVSPSPRRIRRSRFLQMARSRAWGTVERVSRSPPER